MTEDRGKLFFNQVVVAVVVVPLPFLSFPFGSKVDDLRRNFFSVLATERAPPPFLPSSAQSLSAAVPKDGGGVGSKGGAGVRGK